MYENKISKLYTSESVTEGHPDKICDAISDAILDELLRKDPMSRVACETAITTGLVLVMGEITTKAHVDISRIARSVIRDIGYTDSAYGFDSEACSVLTSIDKQSKDIARGVDKPMNEKEALGDTESIGAGDQGIMFGYATDETDTYMPYSISLAHELAYKLTQVRKKGVLPYLRPDGKTQVTMEYDAHNRPVRVEAVVISAQHGNEVNQKKIYEDVLKYIIQPVISDKLIDRDTKLLVNPTGRFVIGGQHGDSGLTGRKIIVDTYGGHAHHGGGAFSGKDPTKVDRTAAYAARYIAKNIVAAEIANRCEIQLSYAIGVNQPISIAVNTFGTGKVAEEKIVKMIRSNFDLSPAGIIKMFNLRRPIYLQTAAYGHFGRRDIELPWERLDKGNILKQEINI